jgi:glycerate kinase
MGAAQALGWRFLDRAGRELTPCGQNLEHIARLVRPAGKPILPALDLLADVDSPLLGERGAARIFGPQKGASPAAVDTLEAGLRNLADRIQQDLGLTVADVPGAGAAGGLGAGALAFFGARLVSGIETVLREVDFETSISGADWVITGEGCLDPTSLQGKVVSGVLRSARAAGARTAVLAGRIRLSPEEWTQAGLSYAAPLASPHLSTDEAIQLAPQLLHDQAQHFAREWL